MFLATEQFDTLYNKLVVIASLFPGQQGLVCIVQVAEVAVVQNVILGSVLRIFQEAILTVLQLLTLRKSLIQLIPRALKFLQDNTVTNCVENFAQYALLAETVNLVDD
jgi:hypothetical protein